MMFLGYLVGVSYRAVFMMFLGYLVVFLFVVDTATATLQKSGDVSRNHKPHARNATSRATSFLTVRLHPEVRTQLPYQ